MRIEDLKIFVDVVKYHSMNIAAENNFTTPQNLSKIIKRMENELGVVLFKRSKKGSDLTLEGEEFYSNIVTVLQQYNKALEAVEVKSEDNYAEEVEKPKISVVCSYGGLNCAVMNAYNLVKESIDGCMLEVDEVNSSNTDRLVDHIKSMRFDVIICYIPHSKLNYLVNELPNYNVLNIFFDEYVLIVSKENPLSKRNIILIEELPELIKNKEIRLIAIKDFGSAEELKDNLQYDILLNSHSKAIEIIKSSNDLGVILSKGYCKMNLHDFSETGELCMVSLKKNLPGAYLIAVDIEKIDDPIISKFVNKIEECLKDKDRV